jgi:hypothetical protein
MFQKTSVADVLSEPGSVTPLCEEKKVMMINTNLAKKRTSTKSAKKRPKKKKAKT